MKANTTIERRGDYYLMGLYPTEGLPGGDVYTVYAVFKQQYYPSGAPSFLHQVGKQYTQLWRARKEFERVANALENALIWMDFTEVVAGNATWIVTTTTDQYTLVGDGDTVYVSDGDGDTVYVIRDGNVRDFFTDKQVVEVTEA